MNRRNFLKNSALAIALGLTVESCRTNLSLEQQICNGKIEFGELENEGIWKQENWIKWEYKSPEGFFDKSQPGALVSKKGMKYAEQRGPDDEPLFLTLHSTDNAGKGADAHRHAKSQYNGNDRPASWHFTVDDTIDKKTGCPVVRQSYDPDIYWCKHAGDKDFDDTSYGNRHSVAIETCVHDGFDYVQTTRNATNLLIYLKLKYPNAKLKTHKQMTTFTRNGETVGRQKDCPSLWEDYQENIIFGIVETVAKRELTKR